MSSTTGQYYTDTPKELVREPLVLDKKSPGWISDQIAGIIEGKTPRWWWVSFIISFITAGFCFAMIGYLITTGVGVWGLNQPVMWGWAIVNFVWWIGIGHAGTLISAILFLMRQKWRTSINRAAEAMTNFAVMCAGIFPAIHVGRIWFVWYPLPIPNANDIWPQFRSPLLWDVFAVSTYFTVSLLFWYMGLIPDLATMRDRFRLQAEKIKEPFKKFTNKVKQLAMVSSRWAGQEAIASGATTKRPTCCWPAFPRRWFSRCTRSCRSTLPCRSCPAGIPPFSRRTLLRALFLAASVWCSRSSSRCARYAIWNRSSLSATLS